MRIEIRTRAVRLFFFSSRRRHTRSDRDWSSDVCSSDLDPVREVRARRPHLLAVDDEVVALIDGARPEARQIGAGAGRSEERRVGKSVDLGGRRIIKKKKKKNYLGRDLPEHHNHIQRLNK